MPLFLVTITTTTSQPIPGAALRLISPDGVDITASRFGVATLIADAVGQISRFYPTFPPDRLPLGVYTLTASASGYDHASVQTPALFMGTGTFTIALPAKSVTAELPVIEAPATTYVSPMAPVEASIGGTDGLTGWEYIEATLTRSDQSTSVMEIPVVNGFAKINLQARLELEPLLQLIPDGANGVVDASFSDKITVTLASLTASGTRPIEGGFTVNVANAFPIGSVNDLANFTNTQGLADWLTPWDELPKFAGYPADAAVWLPVPTAGPYFLRYDYYDVNRERLDGGASLSLRESLFSAGGVVKVRVPEPLEGAKYGQLTVYINDQPQTNALWVKYHG